MAEDSTTELREPHSGSALRAFYSEKARAAGVILETDDEVLIEQAASALDLIAELQRDLDAHGAMLTNAAGTTRTNPAATEIRQQRVALAKLTAQIGHRIDTTVSGKQPRGSQPGVPRGLYNGTGRRSS